MCYEHCADIKNTEERFLSFDILISFYLWYLIVFLQLINQPAFTATHSERFGSIIASIVAVAITAAVSSCLEPLPCPHSRLTQSSSNTLMWASYS
jgi:hypothetical protein